MTARGFTLIELLVALAVGSLALLAAAHIASIGVQSAGRSEQVTELNGRARLVGDQLRTDLTFAGYGSNGAIGVNPAGWAASGAFITALGRSALPAVRASGAVGFTINGITVQPGSDLIQIVVPNPATRRTVDAPIAQGSAALATDPTEPPNVFDGTNGCDFVYLVDHAAPNGAGRTQLVRYAPGGPGRNPLPLSEATMFSLPRGTEVMCARVSTYWVDNAGLLHRSDLSPLGPQVAVGANMVTTVTGNDVVAPGIIDLQLAVTFSNVAPGANLGNHTYGAPPAGGPYVPPAEIDWVEARSVRYTIVARPLRQVTNPGPLTDIPLFEDRVAGGPQLPLSVATQVIAGGVELTNLRYFDEMADSGVAAEPY